MALPTFLVIGAAKSGTTTLHDRLGQHPDICMSRTKETNFFAYGDPFVHQNWPHLAFPVRSREAYEAEFVPSEGETAVGEASPIYFDSRTAAETIARALPDVKLILSLRNPVDRAISGFFMHVRDGAVANDFAAFDFQARYVTGGHYAEKLARYLAVFPRERIAICLFEDLRDDPVGLMRRLYDHVGVDPAFTPDVAVIRNPGRVPKNESLNRMLLGSTLRDKIAPWVPKPVRRLGKAVLEMNRTKPPEFPAGLRRDLVDHYRPEIDRLRDLTGLDLGKWETNASG